MGEIRGGKAKGEQCDSVIGSKGKMTKAWNFLTAIETIFNGGFTPADEHAITQVHARLGRWEGVTFVSKKLIFAMRVGGLYCTRLRGALCLTYSYSSNRVLIFSYSNYD